MGNKVGPRSLSLSDRAFSFMRSGAACHFSRGPNMIRMVFLKIALAAGYAVDGSKEREACRSFQARECNRNVT